MKKVSKSPQRHTFQREGYVKRQEEKGEPVNEDYLSMFDKILEQEKQKFDDPERRKNNMEYDLLTTDWILEKVRASGSYAQNLYAAMCNNDFVRAEMWPVLRMDPDKDFWSCSWRYAGGIIADMRQEGDYIDWYCSGIGGQNLEYEGIESEDAWKKRTGYVPESVVTEEIEKDLRQLGWIVVKYNDTKDIV
jgi:hypothetical protein